MARSASMVSDSEGKPEQTHAPDDDAARSVDMNGDEHGANDEDEEEEDEEYEIAEILKHNKGQFPEGRTGYLVRWKNYGPKHDSWVDENDAGNAQELIDAYWAKVNARNSGSVRKGRKSITTESPEPPKKRRKSVKEDNQDEEPQKKRVNRKKSQTVEPDSAQEEDAEELVAAESYMQQYMKQTSWEKLIARVDTVEKPNDSDGLVVYFRLKKNNRRVRLPAKICNQKFPQLMIGFYESNLKWKETEMDVDSEPAS
ncbi:hypothetical protein J3R30DRAFT_3539041 [Lentinula aciculospora]|uniref:Chromo domain-containing protein n=1 Tax=Lentinula aciculospora TaxID=153920 RepID=A0A9W8ZZK2_9AGAR|nr:hypothetical protein J3R30DRAFT_3539041 [Lentinula aciculospora]